MSKKKKLEKKLEKQCFQFLRSHPSKAFNYKQITAALNLKDTNSRNLVIRILKKSAAKKEVLEVARGKYQWSTNHKNTHEGIIQITSGGNAYVLVDEIEQDVFVHRKNINRAFDGDRVAIYIFQRSRSGQTEGEVVEILERHKTQFVGILQREKNFAFVQTRNARMYTDFFIPDLPDQEFKNGDKVLVSFKDWPKRADSPYGEIVRSLGTPGDTQTEIHAILHDYNLPYEFPEAIEKAAKDIDQRILPEEISKRRDFRDQLTFTIDPITAKDFDDALSFRLLDNGNYEIGVHIADVSFYLPEDSILDQEASERATSVYLVDRVVPMLPEILSNGVCSLRPQEEKYTYSAVFEMDSKGKVYNEWFGRTVIESNHRFAYHEVQYLLESEGLDIPADISLNGSPYTVSKDVLYALQNLNSIAKILRNKRMDSGAISFDRVEVQFRLNQANEPESVFFKTSQDAHKLIEEFMLLANRQVARFIGKQNPRKSFVYRVHDEPDYDKLTNLQTIVGKLGYPLNLNSKKLNQSINQLLTDSHDTPEQQLIDTLTVRCMSKAAYTTENIGHYGLSFDYYTHFTSPIRRYPDVMVHRLLTHYLSHGNSVPAEPLEEQCFHATQREIIATKAERDSIKFMQVKFMEDKLGQHFSGVISGVTDRGIFVELDANKCEGFIRIQEIPGDYYHFDVDQHLLVGDKTQKVYRLGDSIKVEIVRTDLQKRQIDLSIVDDTINS